MGKRRVPDVERRFSDEPQTLPPGIGEWTSGRDMETYGKPLVPDALRKKIMKGPRRWARNPEGSQEGEVADQQDNTGDEAKETLEK